MSLVLKNVKFYHGVGNLADSRIYVIDLLGNKGKARQYKNEKKKKETICSGNRKCFETILNIVLYQTTGIQKKTISL